MARVLNKSNLTHDQYMRRGAVYVGRPTPWGNPFALTEYGRDEAIRLYVEWLDAPDQAELRERIPTLRGKDLVCWCAPEACHADVLLERANRG